MFKKHSRKQLQLVFAKIGGKLAGKNRKKILKNEQVKSAVPHTQYWSSDLNWINICVEVACFDFDC